MRLRVTKVSTTPANPGDCAGARRAAILGEWGAGVDDLAVLAHGTTVATNALLQGEISGLGLIVTDGFRHILEIARQAVPEGYGNSYFWVKPDRIVPLRYVREVGGRLNFLGKELRPLDEASVRAAAQFFRAQGIAAIGVCLLHSYANAAHERRAAAIVREEYPDCTLSLSCDVLPEYREYERAVTTLVDAFVKPHMGRYLERIRDELGPALNRKAVSGDAVERRRRQPRSGDAQADHHGAVRPCRRRARQRGDRRDRRLSRSGDARRRRHLDRPVPDRRRQAEDHQWRPRRPLPGAHSDDRHQDHRHRRRLDRLDHPRRAICKVGPRSAGAEPGPMCYPNGGNEPTITDANLVLGRIPPALIGGGIRLDVERARDGLAALAARLPGNMSAEQLAEGIIEIANWNQANAIRQMTIQRGIDPAAFALLVVRRLGAGAIAGGDGIDGHEDLHRAAEPGQPVRLRPAGRRLAHRSHRHQGHARGSDRPAGRRRHLCVTGKGSHRDAGEGRHRAAKIALVREADVRYAGQSMEVRVPAPAGNVDAQFMAGLIDAFHAAHLKTFGYNYAGQQKVELVNFCVSAFGMIDRPSIPELKKSGAPPQPASRQVYFDGGFRDTPVFARASLGAGFKLDGPAVVEEFGSTTVVFLGQHLTVDPHGILIIKAAGNTAEKRA